MVGFGGRLVCIFPGPGCVMTDHYVLYIGNTSSVLSNGSPRYAGSIAMLADVGVQGRVGRSGM